MPEAQPQGVRVRGWADSIQGERRPRPGSQPLGTDRSLSQPSCGAARAPPRPRGLAPPVTGPEVVVPGVHLIFLLKVQLVRAVVSARAFAAARGSRGQLGT